MSTGNTGRLVRKTGRGFGFIETSNGEDVFVHCKALCNRTWETIDEVDLVEFDLVDSDKGVRAENVRVI
jgi:CspA family cold shock protein